MYELLVDTTYIQVYLDDILITSNGTFEEHAEITEQVLEIMQKANFRANLRKCYFGESKIDYLGYEITRDGIQPQPKKLEAILKLSAPKTKRQLQHFLGMINYYRDMW
jgi:Fic family protein